MSRTARRTTDTDTRVALLVFDGVKLLDVAGPSEVFGESRRYTVALCSPDGADVRTSIGVRLAVDARADRIGPVDTLLVPGSDAFPAAPTPPDVLTALRGLAPGARRIASVCTGAFVLAEAGLLDGRRATTHWRHTATLAHRYPRITVEPDAIHVGDGRVFSSAGVSAGIDLALALVEQDHGAEHARDIARSLVVFMRRPGGQSQFSVPSRTAEPRGHPLRAVLDRIAADPAADHSATALAAVAGTSTRHLTRLFHEALGTTPGRYVELVRLEAAQALIVAGHTVTSAAARSGLGSDETLRRVFLRHLNVSPTAYRNRFAASDAVSWTP
ncbi:GlxA family transcriptional regulator [Umezawaea endophytica]|uniref:DJ-1/PfpI family protein n=1 Tax=Umezawaea endophytica TaxID=1654476 RepID=A0A9X2VJ64_9PSEU|nr:DJ-1/PfpI family protein [Umezawaea endophytica]MCS7477349.1 DJ-1/PfpI family protein [Umezawaea endophytica]